MSMIDLTDAPWQDGFRAGDHGAKGVWTTEDIDAAIEDYSEAFEAAAINTDHEDGGKSKGWIGKMRRVGDVLQWKPRKIDAQLKQDVDDEKFIRQSIELYRKHPKTGRPYVRGIALLGNSTPAVRGLRPIKFSDNVEGFRDEAGNEFVRLECDFAGGGSSMPAGKEKPQDQDAGVMKFTSEEFQAAQSENKDLKQKLQAAESEIANFKATNQAQAGELQALKGQVQDLVKFAAEERNKAHEAKVDAVLSRLSSGKDPKITPAEVPFHRASLINASTEATIPFGDKSEKKSHFDVIVAGLEARSPVMKFGDVAKDGDIKNPNGSDAERFADKAKAAVLEAVKNGILKSAIGEEAARFEAKVYGDLMKGVH